MAHRGNDTLRFGPMKPVGLDDPRTGRASVRGGAAAPGHARRRPLQPGRLPDAVEVGRAGARPAHDSRPRAAPSSCASAWSTATPSSTARRCCCRRGRPRSATTCSSPARCRASRATSNRRHRAWSPGATPRAWPGARRRPRRRAPPPSARWPTTRRTPTRATTSRRTSPSGSCRRSTPAPRDKARRKQLLADRALADLAAWRSMHDELKAFLALPHPQPPPVGAHRARLRQRRVAVPGRHGVAQGTARSRRSTVDDLDGDSVQQLRRGAQSQPGRRAPRWRASCRACARSSATCGAKG